MFRFWIHLWSSFFQRFSDLRCICVDYFMLLLLGVFVCVFCFLFLFLYCHPDIAILVDWALEAKWLTLFYWFVKKTTPLQLTAKVRAAEKLLDRYGLRFLPSFLYPPPSPTLFFQSAGSVNFTCLMLSFQSAGSVHFTCLILSECRQCKLYMPHTILSECRQYKLYMPHTILTECRQYKCYKPHTILAECKQ